MKIVWECGDTVWFDTLIGWIAPAVVVADQTGDTVDIAIARDTGVFPPDLRLTVITEALEKR